MLFWLLIDRPTKWVTKAPCRSFKKDSEENKLSTFVSIRKSQSLELVELEINKLVWFYFVASFMFLIFSANNGGKRLGCRNLMYELIEKIFQRKHCKSLSYVSPTFVINWKAGKTLFRYRNEYLTQSFNG